MAANLQAFLLFFQQFQVLYSNGNKNIRIMKKNLKKKKSILAFFASAIFFIKVLRNLKKKEEKPQRLGDHSRTSILRRVDKIFQMET